MHKNQILFIISLVFASIITIFGVINSEPVVINLFSYKLAASKALIILISAALGAIIAAFLGAAKQISLNRQIKTLRKENQELSAKLKNLSSELSAV